MEKNRLEGQNIQLLKLYSLKKEEEEEEEEENTYLTAFIDCAQCIRPRRRIRF
jgi:hypothetical protein